MKMINVDFKKSVNLKGTTMLSNRTPWCSVMELLDDKFRQQTPMSVLLSTSDATPQYCHSLLWRSNPVASTGCANRPHPRGVGSFKWKLQSPGLFQFISDWSCYLKGMKRILSNFLMLCLVISGRGISLRDPDAGVVISYF